MKVFRAYERRHSIYNADICPTGSEDVSIAPLGTLSRHSDIALSGSSRKMNSVNDDCEIIHRHTDAYETSPQRLVRKGRWRVEKENVSELPDIYPRLLRPLIVENREVSEIGDRLWDFLTKLGVHSVFDSKRGRVLCCTQQLCFVVQFWRRKAQTHNDNSSSNNNNVERINRNESDEEIILEILRRRGCSWAMHKVRSALKKYMVQLQQQDHHPKTHKHHQFRRHSLNLSPFPPPPLCSNGFDRLGLISCKTKHIPTNVTPIQFNGDESESTSESSSTDNMFHADCPCTPKAY